MKPKLSKRRDRAFTLIEVLVVIVVVLILVGLLLPVLFKASSGKPHSRCVNNLKQVGLSFRLWASDNGDKYPMAVPVTNGGTMEFVSKGYVFPHYAVMSNELSTPLILVCPEDAKRTAAKNFQTDLRDEKISFYVGVDADPSKPSMFLAGDANLAINGTPLRQRLQQVKTNDVLTWNKPRHGGAGNVCLADGSVQQLGDKRLFEALQTTGEVTNRLAIP